MAKNKVKRNKLHFLYYICDVTFTFVGVVFSYLTLYWANVGTPDFNSRILPTMLIYAASISILTIIVFSIFKVYKTLTRNFSLTDAIRIALLTFIVNLVGFIIMIILHNVRSLGIERPTGFSWILSTLCLCALLPSLRLSNRFIRLFTTSFKRKEVINTIIIGAGVNGRNVMEETKNNAQVNNRVVAFVDDDISKIGSYMYGIPVVGPISELPTFVNKYNVQEVIIAVTSITEEKIKEIAKSIINLPVRLKRMTPVASLDGPNDKKVFDVDINELLFRSNIELDNSEINNYLANQTVLVTGAGGSIGSELVRQIFKAKPKCIVLFDIYENSTYDIEQELKAMMRKNNDFDTSIKTIIGSTYNLKSIEKVIKKYAPSVIYHAAAYKHVPLMEKVPEEAIRTNCIGTYNVAMLADKYKVSKMILVSTDKAVRPTNAMGASKRFAEMVIQYFASKSKYTTYAAVRFGNVLGSNGSVIPLFQKQIRMGGPVTITDKEMIRYFMTIPEAVSLILQCSLYAKEGEIFILDMGEPVKIIELAERMIKQAGYIPYSDIEIVTIGLRPGEKLYEELLLDKTKHIKTAHNKIFIEPIDKIYPIEEEIVKLSKAFELDHRNDVKDLIKTIVDTYTPDKR